MYGLRLLPEGQRRDRLQIAVESIFNEDFADRILSFDSEAAEEYADIAASRRQAGKPIGQFDAMIAGMVRSRGATLATRNERDFEGCGIPVINPWET